MLQKFFENKVEYDKISYTVKIMEVRDCVKMKLVIACSGGPDSMALFELCREEGIELVAAHVNYHRRPTANRDEQIVKAYCQKYQIPLEVLHPVYEEGNFQNWAREVRYEFFGNVLKKYQCDGVAVAHHEDDVIETYLFQKQRKMIPEYYGIQEKIWIQKCPVVRPLLNWTKKELIAYCERQMIAYGLDETNDTDDYERNRIRHHQVEHMDERERKDVLSDMRMDNLDLMITREMVNTMLDRYQSILPVEVFERLSHQEKVVYLHALIQRYAKASVSTKECEDLIRQLSSPKNVEISLTNCVKLSKMYHLLEITEKKDVLYSYVLDKLVMMKTDFFTISETGKSVEALTLKEDDFPIMIRNARKGDAISLRFGTKKLNRWFIDRKIPRNERLRWPVVLNRHGEVILVPGIGCDLEHYSNNPTCFVLK